MSEEVRQAIKLLRNNGYIALKWTKEMEDAANECEEMEENGESMDCDGCPCNVCLIQI